jgi:hypothetical protein
MIPSADIASAPALNVVKKTNVCTVIFVMSRNRVANGTDPTSLAVLMVIELLGNLRTR